MHHLDPDARIRLPRAAVRRYLAEPRAWLVPVGARLELDVLEQPGGRTVALVWAGDELVGILEGASC